jgi:anionic cell wall polymer biosynthesis LytR-Cps2A-Psr (LCP) family protein
MQPPEFRARRSLYGPPPRPRRRRAPRIIGAVVLIAAIVLGSIAAYRVYAFLRVLNVGNPLQALQQQVEPPVGSIAWKLRHGQQVNILALGYGGAENDAPYLTDSIMAISVDPSTQRIMEISIPRDLYVRIDAWQDGRAYTEKINAAFEVPNVPGSFGPGPLKPAYQGQNGAGHLAEATVSRLTGITFDKYAAVDFKAFRQVVDALGGIQVHMDGPLDDCHYPDYHNGYMNHGVPLGYRCPPGAGIHFPAGDYTVDGEKALELARSRDATEPDQATDFGRSKRQQMIVAAIKKKAVSVSGLTKVPQLMDALQQNFRTDMDVTDITALYNFASKLPDTAIGHLAVTDQNLVDNYPPYTRGSCGPPAAAVLCPEDGTFRMWQSVFSHTFVGKPVLAEKAPVQLVNASFTSPDLQGRTGSIMQGLGFQVGDGVRHTALQKSTIYDFSGGKYPATAAWLQDFYGAQVQPATPATPVQGAKTDGLVVVMGSDFAKRWYGLA